MVLIASANNSGGSEAVEESKSQPVATPSSSNSKGGLQMMMEEIQGHLSDGDSDTHDVTAGETEGNENTQDDQEREIWRRIEQSKY